MFEIIISSNHKRNRNLKQRLKFYKLILYLKEKG